MNVPLYIFSSSLSRKDDVFIHPFWSSTDPPPIQTSEIYVLKVLHEHNALKADDYENIPQGGASVLRRRPLVKEKMWGIVLCACFVFVFFYVLVVWFLYIFLELDMQHEAKKTMKKKKNKEVYCPLAHVGRMLWLIDTSLLDTQANSLERELDPGACLWSESAVIQHEPTFALISQFNNCS